MVRFQIMSQPPEERFARMIYVARCFGCHTNSPHNGRNVTHMAPPYILVWYGMAHAVAAAEHQPIPTCVVVVIAVCFLRLSFNLSNVLYMTFFFSFRSARETMDKSVATFFRLLDVCERDLHFSHIYSWRMDYPIHKTHGTV